MPSVSPAADKILEHLRSRSDDVKKKAQADLRVLVEMEARQMSGEAFSLFIKKLNTCIFELVKSPDPIDKLGGIYAMDGLVDVECEESSTFITRFANYLRQILPCNDVGTMIMASKVLGHLAQVDSRAIDNLRASQRERMDNRIRCRFVVSSLPLFDHPHALTRPGWSYKAVLHLSVVSRRTVGRGQCHPRSGSCCRTRNLSHSSQKSILCLTLTPKTPYR